MKKRLASYSALGAAAAFAAFGGWLVSLPPAPIPEAAPPIGTQESDATLASLKPPKRQRPLIAIIGMNDATDTTAYLMPYGILQRADVADVFTLATQPGPVNAAHLCTNLLKSAACISKKARSSRTLLTNS